MNCTSKVRADPPLQSQLEPQDCTDAPAGAERFFSSGRIRGEFFIIQFRQINLDYLFKCSKENASVIPSGWQKNLGSKYSHKKGFQETPLG